MSNHSFPTIFQKIAMGDHYYPIREPLVDFDVPAILHSLRSHESLVAQDVRRESLIKFEAERKMFKNKPICRLTRKLFHKCEVGVYCLEQRLVEKLHQLEDRWDEIKGSVDPSTCCILFYSV